MISDKLTPESVQITNKLLRSVSTRKPRIKSVLKIRKCILLDEIREVMAKHDELQKTCKSLDAEYVASVTLAEKKKKNEYVSCD